MAPGVPTELLMSDDQPTKTMRPSSAAEQEDSDIEMTTPVADNTMPQLQVPVSHAAFADEEVANVPEENTGVENGEQGAAEGENVYGSAQPWTDTPGWGFSVLPIPATSDGDRNDPGMVEFRQPTHDFDANAAGRNPTGLPHEVVPFGATVPADGDPEIPDDRASDNEQAINNAVAEDVSAEAAAADQANTQDWLAAQDRWLNQLANDNPEEFARLVESGIIDEDFVPKRLAQQGNADNDNTADDNIDENANHAATHIDGQVDDGTEAIAQAVPDATVATTVPTQPTTAPAQPSADGDGNAAPNNPVSNTDHFVWLANRADASNENTTCPACQTEFDPDETIIFLDCGHAWCSDCLNANYRSALKNRQQWPPRCCHNPIGHESIAYLLGDEVQLELAMKVDEFADPNPLFCQTSKCEGGYIGIERRDGQWASCAVCHLSTCVECRAPASAHPMPAMHPNMIERLDKELADGQGWKQCPGCRNLVERTEGCNFMSCECGHEFCYQCGKTLENNMPCDCLGQQQWVADMNNEAAGGRGDDDDDDDDDDDSDSDDSEDEDERDEREERGERDEAARRANLAGAIVAMAAATAVDADATEAAAEADADGDDREDENRGEDIRAAPDEQGGW